MFRVWGVLSVAAFSCNLMQGSERGGAWGFFAGHGVEDMHLLLMLLLLQFGALCPLFRLHGQRAGGPPSDPMCGDTGGDNEVWNLAKDPAHYQALVAMLMLREVGALPLRILHGGRCRVFIPAQHHSIVPCTSSVDADV